MCGKRARRNAPYEFIAHRRAFPAFISFPMLTTIAPASPRGRALALVKSGCLARERSFVKKARAVETMYSARKTARGARHRSVRKQASRDYPAYDCATRH